MSKKEELTTFDRQIRYFAMKCVLSDFVKHKLISLDEYYQLLAMLSQRYLRIQTPPEKEQEEPPM